jgi:hypothetical protein
MGSGNGRQGAERPQELGRLFEERLNAGDVEGLLALYEPEAVLHFPAGNLSSGKDAIRAAYEQTLAARPSVKLQPEGALEAGDPRPPDGALDDAAHRTRRSARHPERQDRRGRPPPGERDLALGHRRPHGGRSLSQLT